MKSKIKYYVNKCTINSFLQHIFETSTLFLALLGNIIFKYQMYCMLTEVTIRIRDVESHVFGLLIICFVIFINVSGSIILTNLLSS